MKIKAEQRAKNVHEHQANMNILNWFLRTNRVEPESGNLDDRMNAAFAFIGVSRPVFQTSKKRERRQTLEVLVDLIRPKNLPTTTSVDERRMQSVIAHRNAVQRQKPRVPPTPRPRIERRSAPISVEAGLAFYKTAEWKRARLDALLRLGRRCGCCGESPETGAVLNVDHIKPLRFNWHLRLDQNNLQILCSDCNQGKGNRMEVDFRGGATPAPDPVDLDDPIFQTREEADHAMLMVIEGGKRP